MLKINYTQICSELLKPLSSKQKEVMVRRFGLAAGKNVERETLESIGKGFTITRERVRQIERDGFFRLKPEIKKQQKIFDHFKDCLRKTGNLRKEEQLLLELGGEKFQKEVFFLLTLGKDFKRVAETNNFYSLWTIDSESWDYAQKTINSICQKLGEEGKPLKEKELSKLTSLSPAVLICYLEISKKIQKNSEGYFGLKEWPEINPRRVKDKAYLVFKKTKKPLHFSQVAQFIGSAHFQTVHNELIKDNRFVLVGRGVYALKEWGYEDGTVKDVILKVLKEARKPLSREEIMKKTLDQRIVKENTVFLNLSDKKHFLKTPEGKYRIQES